MSDPSRDTLAAYESDLNRTVDHRRSLLEQLYATTLSFLEIKAPTYRHDGLASFLDANDISRGKSFDLSTLPGADILGYGVSSNAQLSQEPSTEQHEAAESSRQARAKPQITTLAPDAAEASPARSTRSSAKHPREEDGQERFGGQDASKDQSATTAEGRRAGETGSGLAASRSRSGLRQENVRIRDGAAQRTEAGTAESQAEEHDSQAAQKASGSSVREEIKLPGQKQTLLGSTDTAGSPASRSLPQTSSTQTGRTSDGSTPKTPSDLPSQYLYRGLDADSSMVNAAEQDSLVRPNSGFREHVVNGINRDSSKDLTLSRRPPMQIDTRIPPKPSNGKPGSGPSTASAELNTAPAGTSKQVQTPASAQSPPERMTTRTTSGALRHKSVSEIMGEAPKLTPTSMDKSTGQDESAIAQTPKSAMSFASPDSAAFKTRLNEMREKDRASKLSTVVFARPQPAASSRRSEIASTQQPQRDQKSVADRDYYLTMFVHQTYTPTPNHRVDRQPLTSLIKSAHKTLSSSDLYVDFHERQDIRILHKIHQMQENNKWSLRQPERCTEPDRQATHWDVLLGQVKWMRTDFREEGKWKAAAASHLATACAQWVNGNMESRKLMQVKVRVPPAELKESENSAATPDLIHSAEDDASESVDEDFSYPNGEPPAAIFSLPPDMFIFGLNRTLASEKILDELPLYQPSGDAQEGLLDSSAFLPDASWKTPIVPVSKYVRGKLIRQEEEPPRKRSRYAYEEESQNEQSVLVLDRENEDVALFNPEHKHIRDRIHTGHAFRPPTEHVMPSQAFFETRLPSQWTVAEDDELRRLVREYAYNWSLISSCLSPSSSFSSGAERRTPWECFERWVTLEGLPAEMSKVNYFKAYHARLQAAARVYEAQQHLQQQMALKQNPNAAQIPRRRSTQPVQVDRRKNNKYIHLIDAMRKLAKKRETKLLKDQHAANTAVMRKVLEQKPKLDILTPQQYSQRKYEHQVQREEQIRLHRMQMMQQQQQQQQKALAASRNGQQPSGAGPPASQQHRPMGPGMPNGSSPNMTSAMPQVRGSGAMDVAGSRQRMAMSMMGHGGMANAAAAAGMQRPIQGPAGQRMPPQMGSDGNMRMYQEANRAQAEQIAALQRQRQMQHPQANGQANHMMGNNPNMLASSGTPMSNNAAASGGGMNSPRNNPPQALSSGMTPTINQIQTQLKLRNPQATPQEISRQTTDQLRRMSQAPAKQGGPPGSAHGNNNSNAAGLPNGTTGAANVANMGGGSGMSNGAGPGAMANAQQQYAQLMVQQQMTQHRGNGVSAGNGTTDVSGSRSATPMNQRSGSAQSGRGMSQSPRAGQVGVAGGPGQ